MLRYTNALQPMQSNWPDFGTIPGTQHLLRDPFIRRMSKPAPRIFDIEPAFQVMHEVETLADKDDGSICDWDDSMFHSRKMRISVRARIYYCGHKYADERSRKRHDSHKGPKWQHKAGIAMKRALNQF